jgi:hypothetical protein
MAPTAKVKPRGLKDKDKLVRKNRKVRIAPFTPSFYIAVVVEEYPNKIPVCGKMMLRVIERYFETGLSDVGALNRAIKLMLDKETLTTSKGEEGEEVLRITDFGVTLLKAARMRLNRTTKQLKKRQDEREKILLEALNGPIGEPDSPFGEDSKLADELKHFEVPSEESDLNKIDFD